MKCALLVAWAVLLLGPLATPVILLASRPDAFSIWNEWNRLGSLAANTALLCLGTVSLAVPIGWFLGIWAGRFGGRATRGALLLAAFVPLPISALAWQTLLANWLPPLNLNPGEVAWRPWAVGLLPAIWVHATIAIPWVAWVVASAVRRTSPELEDEAIQTGGARTLLRRVLLPRSLSAAVLGGIWVCSQPLTEITVSDMMMVRSAAEEVYTEMVSGGTGLPKAVAVTIPFWLTAILAGVLIGRPLTRFQLTTPETVTQRPVELPGRWRWLLRGFAGFLMLQFLLLPLAALVWKAAGGSADRGPTLTFLVGEFGKVWGGERWILLRSVGAAVLVGAATAFLAWLSCWVARTSRLFQMALYLICVTLLLAPGPVVGLGLKQFIDVGMSLEERIWPRGPIWSLLYYQSTPFPAGWAALLRFFPIACAILWPAIRAIPDELLDAAKMDGWSITKTWQRLVVPLTLPQFWTALIAVAALALGEVSAGKLVNPPGYRVYVLWLFDQMHYGSETLLAAMALTQLATTSLLVGGLGFLLRFKSPPR